jgi:ABC-2 type transport system ATP-binding protein
MILGPDAPTSGSVTVSGRANIDYPAPLHQVGALLDAKAVHTWRMAEPDTRRRAAKLAAAIWRCHPAHKHH